MQDMSPDMEDLLRKAAEAYPLKQMDDRWEEIASKAGAAPAPLPPKKQGGYRRYFMVLLLLLLFLFTGDYLMNRNSGESTGENKTPAYATKKIETKQTTQSSLTSIPNSNTLPGKNAIEINKQQLTNTTPFYKTPVLNATGFSNSSNEIAKRFENEEPITNASVEATRRIQHEIVFDKTINLVPNNFSFQLHNQPFFTQQDSKQKNNYRNKGFYYGITAGLSFNSVKEQNLKTGWDLGLLGGYYANNRLSLETGVLISQKYYWTSGNYFSMEKLGPSMPSSTKIMEVDGSSKVIEIPLHIRYAVLQNSRRNIFSSAGFSSYILTREYNQYHTSANGSMQMMYGTYKNNRSYFASSLDLSIGYEQNLSKNKSIRLQPYIQIPVKGIGMGDLPVMSTGLRIALVKRAN